MIESRKIPVHEFEFYATMIAKYFFSRDSPGPAAKEKFYEPEDPHDSCKYVKLKHKHIYYARAYCKA